MKPIKHVLLSGMFVAALMASARAQNQTTGTPSATTTISGEQLPAPPGQFGGPSVGLRPNTWPQALTAKRE